MRISSLCLTRDFVAVAIFLAGPLGTPQTVAPLPSLATGTVIASVASANDPSQSYALYLPSSYTPTKRWPIIYALDPLARGRLPLDLYKEIAEKYSYILAGSNNSRNFAPAESERGTAAMWQDTHARLSVDPRRTYATGFSGGARAAGAMAMRCRQCQIAGVIAHGAGYPGSARVVAGDGLLYFFSVGNRDFNWPEVISIRRQREDLGLPYRVEIFAGPHRWAPPEIFEHAVEWLQLKAMQAGTLAPDPAFLKLAFERTQKQAEDAARQADAIAELNAYRSLVSDFSGLKDVSAFEKNLTTLKTSAALKHALRKEQDEISEQASLVRETAARLSALGDDAEQQLNLRDAISQEMRRLSDLAAHDKSEEKRNLYARAFSALWAEGIETGQAALELHHFMVAQTYFELMGELKEDPWPFLLLAETRTAMGNHRQAIKDLHEAVKRGLENPETLQADENLQPLSSDPEFQKLLAELKAK
jgi:dienelactone hydrolase